MRFANGELLHRGLSAEIGPAPGRAPQDGIYQGPAFANRQLDRLKNRGVLGGFEQKELIKAEAQQVAGGVVEMAGTETVDPIIEQRQVPQDAVKKFRREGAIRRR
jgi:hypothetical protein